MIMSHYFYDLTHFLEARAEIQKYFSDENLGT